MVLPDPLPNSGSKDRVPDPFRLYCRGPREGREGWREDLRLPPIPNSCLPDLRFLLTSYMVQVVPGMVG